MAIAVLLLVLLFLVGTFGCAPIQTRQFAINDVPEGHGELIAVKASPGYEFWDPRSKAFIVNPDGKIQFIPLNSDSADLLSEVAGPIGSVASHVTIPLTPAP